MLPKPSDSLPKRYTGPGGMMPGSFAGMRQERTAKPAARSYTNDPKGGVGMTNGLRMGFGQKVGQLCQKHPNVELAPLFPDLTSGTPRSTDARI